jgi:hypothetical protein
MSQTEDTSYEWLYDMNCAQLKKQLTDCGAATTGLKNDLRSRLKDVNIFFYSFSTKFLRTINYLLNLKLVDEGKTSQERFNQLFNQTRGRMLSSASVNGPATKKKKAVGRPSQTAKTKRTPTVQMDDCFYGKIIGSNHNAQQIIGDPVKWFKTCEIEGFFAFLYNT